MIGNLSNTLTYTSSACIKLISVSHGIGESLDNCFTSHISHVRFRRLSAFDNASRNRRPAITCTDVRCWLGKWARKNSFGWRFNVLFSEFVVFVCLDAFALQIDVYRWRWKRERRAEEDKNKYYLDNLYMIILFIFLCIFLASASFTIALISIYFCDRQRDKNDL